MSTNWRARRDSNP